MNLKQKLKKNKLTIGSWLSLGDTAICEMMLNSYFDWLVIDMEHTSIGVQQCIDLIRIIEISNTTPLVRVGENNPLLIKRALDAGAHGIIVPMVNTVEDVHNAINATYYSPRGERGVGLARAQKYGIGFKEYKKWADSETILIIQIEHKEGVKNLEKLISIEGVDAFIIGPYDLSSSLGHPGEWEHDLVKNTLKYVEKVIDKKIKSAGYHIVNTEHNKILEKIKSGYNFIAYGSDIIFFSEKIKDENSFIKSII